MTTRNNQKELLITKKEYLAKGKRGIAYTATLEDNSGKRKILIKEKNPTSDVDTLANEARILRIVNKKHIGPEFIAITNTQLLREFINGPEILNWIPGAAPAQIKTCFIEILRQCRDMDLLGINKLEMNHPHKHILIVKNKPVMIDFDRSREAARPKNVTQVLQWLTNKELEQILERKNLHLNREALLAHARQYKKEYSKVVYEHIIENIENA